MELRSCNDQISALKSVDFSPTEASSSHKQKRCAIQAVLELRGGEGRPLVRQRAPLVVAKKNGRKGPSYTPPPLRGVNIT